MTEPPYLTATRSSYDTVAAAYAERVPPLLAKAPLARAMLAAFELLSQAGMPVTAQLLSDGKQWPQACLLARKTHA